MSQEHAEEITEASILNHLKVLASRELDLPEEKVEQIRLDTGLVEGLQLDSLAQAVLIAGIEEQYGFVFEAEDREQLVRMEKVEDFARLVVSRAKNPPTRPVDKE